MHYLICSTNLTNLTNLYNLYNLTNLTFLNLEKYNNIII